MLVAPLSVLVACSESIGFVEPPMLAGPPLEFSQQCSRPVDLPNRELTQSDVETYWITDRSELISCGERHQAIVDFYRDRDDRITQR